MSLVVVDIGRLDEAHLALEAGAVVPVGAVQGEGMSAALELEVTCRPSRVGRRRAAIDAPLGRAFPHLTQGAPLPRQPRREVEAADPVPAAAKLFVGVDRTNAGA